MKFNIGHPDNFCGGNFQDWLEVNLTPACNANCSWCIENKGWHPKEHADWFTICNTIVEEGRKNVILLGGEPTLHPDLQDIIEELYANDLNVYITTNGSMLTPEWVNTKLKYVHGVNISIHHSTKDRNAEITGIHLNEVDLAKSIDILHRHEATVRFNCNCISGYIDNEEEILAYIAWAKKIGADSVRFAELKGADKSFVDLAKILDHKYGLNDDPFQLGCNKNCVIDGMLVNFRQMCGMQTDLRPCPQNPRRIFKPVVYYDGKVYDGWQLKKENDMTKRELKDILEMVADGRMQISEAADIIEKENEKIEEARSKEESSHCRY